MKKRNNQQDNITPHAPLPYSPPNYARDLPYDPAYHPAQPAQVTLAQPMPYDIVATLGRKNSNDSMWEKVTSDLQKILRASRYFSSFI